MLQSIDWSEVHTHVTILYDSLQVSYSPVFPDACKLSVVICSDE